MRRPHACTRCTTRCCPHRIFPCKGADAWRIGLEEKRMTKPQLNVAMIGYDFMGRTHSNAWRQVGHFFPDVPARPVLKVVVGRTEAKVREARDRLGFEQAATSWEEVIARKD